MYLLWVKNFDICHCNVVWKIVWPRWGSSIWQVFSFFVLNVIIPLSRKCNCLSRLVTRTFNDKWFKIVLTVLSLNTLRPRQDGRHFPDDIFKWIFLNENLWISLQISLKFIPQVSINNIPALVKIMAWRCSGEKPLSETMMVILLMYICVTRPQWIKHQKKFIQTLPPKFSDSLWKWSLPNTRKITALTHLLLVPHICASKLGWHWFR